MNLIMVRTVCDDDGEWFILGEVLVCLVEKNMFVLNGDVMAVSESNSQVSVRHMMSRSNSWNISISSSTLLLIEANYHRALSVAGISWM